MCWGIQSLKEQSYNFFSPLLSFLAFLCLFDLRENGSGKGKMHPKILTAYRILSIFSSCSSKRYLEGNEQKQHRREIISWHFHLQANEIYVSLLGKDYLGAKNYNMAWKHQDVTDHLNLVLHFLLVTGCWTIIQQTITSAMLSLDRSDLLFMSLWPKTVCLLFFP